MYISNRLYPPEAVRNRPAVICADQYITFTKVLDEKIREMGGDAGGGCRSNPHLKRQGITEELSGIRGKGAADESPSPPGL